MFTHLHVHSQYSIADATCRVDELCKRVAELGMDAVAITDHDNLHGAVHFAQAAKANGIKPIYGCCLSVAARPVGEHVLRTHHITLLAQNMAGYKNLLYLISKAHLQAPSGGKPRIDHALLAERHEGLICLSGDLAGEVPNAVLRGQSRDADRHIKRLLDIFGKKRFFIELQRAGLIEHDTLATGLTALADKHGVRCVATGDVHYLDRSDASAHEVLMCIGLGLQAPADRDWLPTSNYYLADEGEMRRRFADRPDAVDAAAEIAAQCNVELVLGKNYLPQYDVPDGETIESYFAKVSREGLQERFDEFERLGKTVDRDAYRARLQTEIDVITGMDFPGYFLIVWDFILWSKQQGIPVGPGRGSGAGSLVAYSLKITDIDPLPYNLLFERFLNPERVSMPDFDIDFCVKRRGDVIAYVADKYGNDHVAQIATFGTLKAKGSIRDCGRVLGIPLATVDEIAKLVPDDLKMTVKKARNMEPRLRERAAADPDIERLLQTAEAIEGAVRNVGMHAAGVVISENPLWDYVPVSRGLGGENVTQFAKDEVEEAGLVKFDFLGLKNLTMIDHCVKLINDKLGDEKFDISAIPLDSPEAYDVMCRGDTAGVFQMESSGFTGMITKLRPSEFEDVIAAGALYRPGPLGMGMHDRYIQRKHKREPVTFDHPLLEPILKETYGVIVYQEQVMQIAREMAGYTLGGADILRRAMGKKKAKEMEKQRKIFIDGSIARGVPEKTAKDIFSLMESFASYGFNKSHAAAYGLITYQTAYLKAHYRTEFFAALLTADRDDTNKVVAYMQEARRVGIKVLPPDINASKLSFSVVNGVIRFGLGAIKGVGSAAIDVLLAARDEGPFKSLFDLCRRVDVRKINKRVLEALVKCGAFDCFGESRETLWNNIGKSIDRANIEQKERESGQVSLFGSAGATSAFAGALKVEDVYIPATETWTARQTLEYEKECLGFYVTGHPLDRFQSKLWRLDCRTLAACTNKRILEEGGRRGRVPVKVAVVVVSFRELKTRAGKSMGILVIEDLTGQAELMVFEGTLNKCRETLKSDVPLLMNLTAGRDRRDEDAVRLVIDGAEPLSDAVAELTDYLRISLQAEQCGKRALRQLKDVLIRHQKPFGKRDDAENDATAVEDIAADRQVDLLGGRQQETDAESAVQAEATDHVAEKSGVTATDAAAANGSDGQAAGDANGAVADREMTPVLVELQVRVPGKGLARVVANSDLKVLPSDDLIGELERLIGRGTVALS